MILRDLICLECDRKKRNVWVEGQDYPKCRCGNQMSNWVTKVTTDGWGGPQYHPAIDNWFASRSDLRKYMKEHKLVEAGDRVGGARNEDYLNLGKRFSYKGKQNRSGGDYAETRKERTLVKGR